MSGKRTDFFTPGNAPIRLQTVLLALRALGVGVTLWAVGQLVGGAFAGEVSGAAIAAGVAGALVAVMCEYVNGMSKSAGASLEEKRVRQALLSHAFGLGPARFTGKETGRIVSLMTDSVERVATYRQGYLGQLIGSVLTPFLTLALIAVLIDWLTALVLLVCLPFVPLVIGIFQKQFRKDSAGSRRIRGKLASQFLEAIQNLPTLVGLRAADRIGESLAETGETNRKALMKVLARNQLLLFVTEAVFALFLVSVGVAMAWVRLRSGTIGIGDAVALVLLTTQLTTPITQVGGFFYIGMGGRAGQSAILGFLARKASQVSVAPSDSVGNSTDVGRTADAGDTANIGAVANDSGAPESAVNFSDVGFSYTKDQPILHGLNFEVFPGQRTAFVGSSGSGKSTILSIMAGDLVPIHGVASVDGVVLAPMTQEEVRGKSACVNQQTWLFHGTLAENLRVARSDASEAEMLDALEAVNLRKWVDSLPEGLGTPVGERGMAVSGGQAQRISIARAILAGRDLVLFDEPTSQVDLHSERIIERAIDDLARRATVVVATHRPALAKGDVYRVSDGHVDGAKND